MGTVLAFRPSTTVRPTRDFDVDGEVVIFPGVRIERHELDLGYRIRDATGTGEFTDLGNTSRPRKTS